MSTPNPTVNPLLRHPLIDGDPNRITPLDAADALNKAVDTLRMLADLFGSDASDYTTLNSVASRHGMYWQLDGLADLLTGLSQALAKGESPC